MDRPITEIRPGGLAQSTMGGGARLHGRRPSGSGPIKVAIVGYGAGAQRYHVPYLKALEGFFVSAVVCGDPGRQSMAKADFPYATVCDSVPALLRSGTGIHLAIVATPNNTHGHVSRLLLQAGLDIVIDKPIALTAIDAQSILCEAERNKCIVVPYLNRRWDSDFVAVQRAVSAGVVGRMNQLVSRVDRWRPFAKDHWSTRSPHEDGGGIVHGFGTHLVDQALLLQGPIDLVRATIACARVPAVPDAFRIELTHASGARSIVSASDTMQPRLPRFTVRGTAGTIRIHGMDPQEELIKSGVLPSDKVRWDAELSRCAPVMTAGEPGRLVVPATSALEFWVGLERYLTGSGSVPVSCQEAIEGLRVLDAAHESWLTKTVVRL